MQPTAVLHLTGFKKVWSEREGRREGGASGSVRRGRTCQAQQSTTSQGRHKSHTYMFERAVPRACLPVGKSSTDLLPVARLDTAVAHTEGTGIRTVELCHDGPDHDQGRGK